MKINQIIQQRRKELSLTQTQVADYLGVLSTPAVNKREQELSVPDADLLITLSEALETHVSALPGETVPAPKTDGLEVLAYFLQSSMGPT